MLRSATISMKSRPHVLIPPKYSRDTKEELPQKIVKIENRFASSENFLPSAMSPE